MKLSKTKLSKIIQSGVILGRLPGQLLKTGLTLTKNSLKTLAESALIPQVLRAVASATDAAIPNKIRLGAKNMEKKMEDIIKIGKYLEVSDLLIKIISQTM